MDDSNAVDFWHSYLGRYLSDAPAQESSKARLPTRLKRGVDANALGAGIAAYYVVTPTKSWLHGKIEKASDAHVEFVAADAENKVSGEQFIARWLVSENFATPCMIGVIGNASPNASFRVSYSAANMLYCEAGKGFCFSLDKIKRARELIGDQSWSDTISPATRQYFALLEARVSGKESQIEREATKMTKLIEKNPALATIIPTMDIRPGSGEYIVLGWLYRQ